MRPNALAAAAGALFGVGLAVAGMTRPGKVIGFLDLTGAWDASLAFVMVGAIFVHFVALRLIKRRGSPLFDQTFHLPTRRDLDPRLLGGAAVFGIGWGIGGYCPGPGLVSAGAGSVPALVFVVGMTIGMVAEHAFAGALARRAGPGTTTEPADEAT